MIERELERRDLLRRVAALREDLNRAYEPLNIVRPQFGNNVRPRTTHANRSALGPARAT